MRKMMRILKSICFVGIFATVFGCGDSKTQGPPSLKQEMPKSGPGGVDKSMKKGVER